MQTFHIHKSVRLGPRVSLHDRRREIQQDEQRRRRRRGSPKKEFEEFLVEEESNDLDVCCRVLRRILEAHEPHSNSLTVTHVEYLGPANAISGKMKSIPYILGPSKTCSAKRERSKAKQVPLALRWHPRCKGSGHGHSYVRAGTKAPIATGPTAESSGELVVPALSRQVHGPPWREAFVPPLVTDRVHCQRSQCIAAEPFNPAGNVCFPTISGFGLL